MVSEMSRSALLIQSVYLLAKVYARAYKLHQSGSWEPHCGFRASPGGRGRFCLAINN